MNYNKMTKKELIERIRFLEKNSGQADPGVQSSAMNANLSDQEKKFKTYIEHAPFGVFVVNKNGRYLEVNNTACQMTGFSEKELLKKNLMDLLPPGEKEKGTQHFKKVVQTGKAIGDIRYLKKDGRIGVWNVSAVQLSNDRFLGFVSDITKRTIMEEELQNSQKLLQDVLDNIPAGVFWKGVDNKYLGCNLLFARDAGKKSPAEVIGQDDFALAWKKHAAKFQKEDAAVITTGEMSINSVKPYYTDSGKQKWHRISKIPLQDKSGRIFGMLGIYDDITRQMEAQSALKESEVRLRNIIEHSTNLFYSHTPDHILTYVSPQSYDFFDCSPEEAMVHWTEFATEHPVNEKGFALTEEAIRTGKNQHPYQLQLKTKTGRILWVEVNEAPVVEDGKTVAIVGSLTDITKSKVAQDELKKSEEKFRQLAHMLPEVIFEADLEGKLTFVNKQAFKIFGYKKSDIKKGINALDRIIPEDRARARANIERVLKGQPTVNSEYTARRKDGSLFPVLIYSNAIYNAGVPVGFRGIIVDVTERRALEDQLRQSQKMEAIGRLAGGVAHDFNNLLTIINGFCDLLLMNNLEPETTEVIRQIHDAGLRAAGLTEQLLAFSRKQIVQRSLLNLNDVINRYLKTLGRLLGENIEMSMHFDPDLKHIKADAGQIEQVLMNIGINARDAMSDGGSLTITTQNVYINNPGELDNEIGNGEYVKLVISDTGDGMDEKILAHIFEPFFTTKEQGKGTGLGLATVYGIVRQNGGTIRVESAPNMGSRFTIYLPAAEETKKQQVKGDNQKVGLHGKESILLVEDDNGVREVTQKTLSKYGYNVFAASNGEEGLQYFEQHKDELDLVLTDIMMPLMSGRELADKVRDIKKDIRILFFSGYSEGSNITQDIKKDGVDFIQKPYTQKDLMTKIKSLISK